MTDAGFFRGTSSEQDNRFSDKEKKLLKQMKFADNLTTKIEMNKIKLDVLRPWIEKRISELLGMEDEVVADFVVNQLEAEKNPDARKIQINLTGFLNGKNARIFIGELWDILIAAQESPSGIPASMIEAKKQEIKKRNEDQERINESLKRTVSRFTEKLKEERESPPSRRDRSSSRDRDSKRTTKTVDGDDTKSREESGASSKRNYRGRRSASASPESNNKRKSRSRSGSREKKNRDRRAARSSRDNSRDRERERNRRGPGGPDRSRDNRPRRSRSPRPQRRSRSRSPQRRPRSRSPLNRGAGRAPSPRAVRRPPFNESRNIRNDSDYRDAPVTTDREKLRSKPDDRRSRSPNLKEKPYEKSGDRNRKEDDSPEPRKNNNKTSRNTPEQEDLKDTSKGSVSPSSNGSSSPENGVSSNYKTAKKFRSSSVESEKSDEGDQSKKKEKKDKKKKKDKKHKKHKKHNKKLKKPKDKQKSSSEGENNDVGKSTEEIEENGKVILLPNEKMAQSFLKLVQSEDPSTEDLERKLREKALESMKKANMNR